MTIKKRTGRPPKPESIVKKQQDELLERHANGETITSITRSLRISIASPWRWEAVNPEFGKRYARARAQHAHASAAQAIDIADGVDEVGAQRVQDMVGAIKGASPKDRREILNALASSAVQRDRLRTDTRKWYTGKVLPRVYGDKLDLTSGGEVLRGVIAVPIERPDDA